MAAVERLPSPYPAEVFDAPPASSSRRVSVEPPGPSFGHLSPDPQGGSTPPRDYVPSSPLQDDLSYFFVPSGATLSMAGFQAGDGPLVPLADLHVGSFAGKRVIAFRRGFTAVVRRYVPMLSLVPRSRQVEPTQRARLRELVKRATFPEFPLQPLDRNDPESALVPPPSDRLESLATRARRPQKMGNEQSLLPRQPTVVLRPSDPELSKLMGFLSAPPLSPTSHRLHPRYGADRATLPVPADKMLVDKALRRGARNMVGIDTAFSTMRSVLRRDDLSAEDKVDFASTIVEAFAQDVALQTEFSVLQAVRHRRWLIDHATSRMSQPDVQEAVRQLPLAEGDSLYHQGAQTTVEETLRLPETRQLAPMRPVPPPRRPAPPARPAQPLISRPSGDPTVRRPTRPTATASGSTSQRRGVAERRPATAPSHRQPFVRGARPPRSTRPSGAPSVPKPASRPRPFPRK